MRVSSTDSSFNLTVANSASRGYSLKVMTIVAVVLLPVVLAYQDWSYYLSATGYCPRLEWP